MKARYDAIIMSNRKPPGPAYVALGEVMVHGEDIRRSLGAQGEHPDGASRRRWRRLYKKTGAPLHGKKRVEGLKLQATDVDWSTGDGPEVTRAVHVVDPRRWSAAPARSPTAKARASRRCAPARSQLAPVAQSSNVVTVFQFRVVAFVASLRSKKVLLIFVRP